MKSFIKYILDRFPYIGRLRKHIRHQQAIIRRLKSKVKDIGEFNPGHFYSPIPLQEEVESYLHNRQVQKRAPCADVDGNQIELPEIDLNTAEQFELLKVFADMYPEVPFPEQKTEGFRYRYNQGTFCYADAIMLYSFLRHVQPKRIIEVGSGFSSAVILDAADRCFTYRPELTFIEPNPKRLRSILRLDDEQKVQIHVRKVQEVPLEIFAELEAGDLLFMDSSHVVKCGSDVQFLMFEVIPRLPVGVYLHFHDMFYPFEYPQEWLLNRRHWNEDYFLRAFLAYNSEWKIVLFNTYVATVFRDFLAEQMPLCLKDTGGSIYLQRINPG